MAEKKKMSGKKKPTAKPKAVGTSEKEVKTWDVGPNTVKLISVGRFKVVEYKGDVVFDNAVSGGSFNAFWKSLKKQTKDFEWKLRINKN